MIALPTGKRRSGKVSPNSSTPKSKSPASTPVVESKWHIAARASRRNKRKSLQISPPLRSPASSVLIDSGDAVADEVIYEEPINTHLPLTPARLGPGRTRPYEAPYFFPTPGSPEAIGYVERVREDRRSAPVQPDPTTSTKNKKDLKRSSTMSSLEKGRNMKPGEEGSQDQATEVSSKKRSKCDGKGFGTKNPSPSSSPTNELGVRARTPIPRKSSAPAQLSSPDLASTPTTPNRPQTQRQGSMAIMRMLGKH